MAMNTCAVDQIAALVISGGRVNHIVIAQILHTGNGAATLQLRAVAHSRFSRSKAQSPWIDNGGSRSQQRTTHRFRQSRLHGSGLLCR